MYDVLEAIIWIQSQYAYCDAQYAYAEILGNMDIDSKPF